MKSTAVDAATPLAATLQWILRDGTGMLGSVLFASWGGRRFDVNVKTWRLFADVINDIGLTLELLSPLFGAYFIYVAVLGSICKSLCGVAAGATRAVITAHFAAEHNIADVAAKENAQETAVTLLGLISGLLCAKILNANMLRIWIAFFGLTALHVVANYRYEVALIPHWAVSALTQLILLSTGKAA